jgi:hypothetical protein
MSGPERPASGLLRRAGLYYLLATTYLVARVMLDRVLLGMWALSVELVVDVILVGAAQAVVLEFIRPLSSRTAASGSDTPGEPEAGH